MYQATLLRFGGIKVCGVPQPKPVHEFSAYFQDMFTLEDLELIFIFWKVSDESWS